MRVPQFTRIGRFRALSSAIVLLLVASHAFDAMAQVSQGTNLPVYVTTPFDESVSQLPAGFRGHNATQIIGAIRTKFANTEKSQFETDAQYELRMKQLASRNIVGSLTPESVLAFVLGPLPTKYNAETSQLSVDLGLSPEDLVIADHKEEYTLYPWWSQSHIPLGSYAASNAFGAKVIVNRYRVSNIGIALERLPNWLLREFPATDYGTYESSEISLQMDSAIAQKVARKLKMVIIGTLVAPFVSVENIESRPTIGDPNDMMVTTSRLRIKLRALWLFDPDTGDPVARYNDRP